MVISGEIQESVEERGFLYSRQAVALMVLRYPTLSPRTAYRALFGAIERGRVLTKKAPFSVIREIDPESFRGWLTMYEPQL